MKRKIVCSTIALMTGLYICKSEIIKVVPEKSVIVLPTNKNENVTVAAQELSKHLKLITGADIEATNANGKLEGKYPFYLGIPLPGDQKKIAPEEARWAITPEAIYLYGHSQFAVYGFLEDELGVRWIEPGDVGIAYKPQSPLKLKTGEYNWAPVLGFREVRGDKSEDTRIWQKRMRMGSHLWLSYGHAFTIWWEKYGKTHPEYFAMKKDGQREPANSAKKSQENIKLCPSNPKVADQIIQNWLANPKRGHGVNVCENDSPPENFCTCSNCVALDVRIEDHDEGPFGQHLTDRYVYLVNMVARKAREHDPEAFACTYAYNEAEQPPRKQKLEPNVVLGFVPTTANTNILKKLFHGWREMGATRMSLRPNLHHYYFQTVLPMGFEKQFYDVFQTAFQEGCVGVDYDSLRHMWPVTGLADYIQIRAFSEPSKPFEYWEALYCSAYGAAAEDVKKYFRYWREELWEKRLLPDMENIVERGRYFNFYRGVMWALDKYYKPEDFDRTDAMLQQAAKKALSDSEKARLEQLVLANKHARLVFKAGSAQGTEKHKYALELLDFREKYKDKLRLAWSRVSGSELYYGDVTGTDTATRLKEFALPWLPAELFWRFKMDPMDKGIKENWQSISFDDIKTSWDNIRTDYLWENQQEVSAALKEKLTNYDGIGWYATLHKIPPDWKNRKIFLYFGAVDESCWLYVNGKPAGDHIFKNDPDWSTPFTIRIDPCIDWSKEFQQFTVRVEDKRGGGGIWRRVWIVSEKIESR